MPRCEHPSIIGSVQVDRSSNGSGAVVWVAGEQDLSNAALLARALESAAAHGGDVVVDIAAVTFLSAAALHAVVRVRDELARRGATLALRAPDAWSRRVLDICGLSGLVDPLGATGAPLGRTPLRPRALVCAA